MENNIFRQNEMIAEFDNFVLCTETDLNGVITQVSQKFCEVSGYTREELIGSRHSIVRDPDTADELFQQIWRDLKDDKRIIDLEIKNKHKNGHFYWMLNSFFPIFNDQNEKVGYRCLRKDITDKKKLEEANREIKKLLLRASFETATSKSNEYSTRKKNELLQKDIENVKKEIVFFQDDLVSIFTHELKTPLNAMINFAEYIFKNITRELTEKRLKNIALFSKRIIDNGNIQYDMVNSLLQVATIKSGKIEIHLKKENIQEILFPIIERYKGIYDKEIIINVDNLVVETDKKLCRMVFSNLLSNALKYSHSTIMIHVKKIDGKLSIEIEDDGPGISPEKREKIFDLFTQSNDTSVLNMEKTGTGIGLYTVKQLVLLCNKRITIKTSKKLGGAKFIITEETTND